MLRETLERQETFSTFGMLHLLCMTPDMFRFYFKASDERLVDQVFSERGDERWCEDVAEEFFAAVKTALVVEAWYEEVPEDMICENFGVGVGDIHAVVENLRWLMHAAWRITQTFAPRFDVEVRNLEIRIENGVKEELLPLIELRGIGRVRARWLFNRGITTPEALLTTDPRELVPVLGTVLTKNIVEQAAKKTGKTAEMPDLLEERTESVPAVAIADQKPQKTLFDFGE